MSNSPYDGLVPVVTPEQPEIEMNSKPIMQSKTFWVNMITAIAGIVTSLGASDLIADNPQYAGIAATVIGVVNVILRLMTKTPVTIK